MMNSSKPCCRCGVNPRMVSRTGKPLTMCESCQREYWRQQKPKKNPPKAAKSKAEPTAKAPKLKRQKTVPQGRPYKYERLERPIKVLVVNRRSGFVGRAEVEATDFKPIRNCRDEASIQRVMALFSADGYVVQEIKDE